MFGFILGILLFLIGIGATIYLASYKEVEEAHYKKDKWGEYERDTEGNKIMVEASATKPLKKYSCIGIIAGFVLCLIFSVCIPMFTRVDTGKTGVVTTFGKIENYTLDSGFHIIKPWNKVTEIDTTVNEVSINTPAYTNDSQTVDLAITIQYRISTAETFNVVADNGLKRTQEILESKLENRIMTVAKNIVAKKKADDLLTKRSDLVAELAQEIDAFNDEYYVIIAAVNLTNIDFTDEYEAAVAAKVAQQQAYEKALIEQQQALKQAENDKLIAETKASAEAEVAKIQAEADLAVQKINADAAEYTGKKESAVVLNRLAGINGWTVVLDETDGIYKLFKTDGTEVTETERAKGVEKLLEYYYTQAWNGILPDTYVGDGSVSSILIGGTN